MPTTKITPAPADSAPAAPVRRQNRWVKTPVPRLYRIVPFDRTEPTPGDQIGFLAKSHGKQIRRSLGVADMREAQRLANILMKEITAKRWANLDTTSARSAYASLPQVCKTYEQESMAKSARNNVNRLNLVVQRAGGDPKGSTAQLTRELVYNYQKGMTHRFKSAPVALRRASVTANSALRCAKSVFAERTLPMFKGLKLPDLWHRENGFMTAPFLPVPETRYVPPPPDIMQRLADNYPALRESDPGVYAAFLLGAFCGLRNAEASAARWDWIEAEPGGGSCLALRTVETVKGPDGKTQTFETKTGVERFVPISAGVIAALEAVRGAVVPKLGEPAPGDRAYLIPSPDAYNRSDALWRRFSAWAETQGLTRGVSAKKYYELRKYYGNVHAWKEGPYQAARWMGNSAAIVERHYSDARGRQPFVIPEPEVPRARKPSRRVRRPRALRPPRRPERATNDT